MHVYVAEREDIDLQIRYVEAGPNSSLSMGPPLCRYCRADRGGQVCHCEGAAKARRSRAVAAATKTLESYGYTVTPPAREPED